MYSFKVLFLRLLLIIFLLPSTFLDAMNNENDISTFKYKRLAGLNTAKITTGILYEKSLFSKTDINKFRGDTLSDTITLAEWKDLYAQIYYSYIDKPSIPSLHEIDSLSKTYIKKSIIPIAILNTKYNKIKQNAIEDGLLAVKDNQLTDVSSKSDTPYEEDEIFIVSATKDYSYTLDVNFLIDEAFTHNAPVGYKFYVDFGEESHNSVMPSSYREVTMGEVIEVKYFTTGPKTVRIGIGALGGSLIINVGSFKFWVRTADIPPVDFAVERSGLSWGGVSANYEAFGTYGYGNNTGKFNKPLIIVEGFDPGNDFGYEELYLRVNAQNLANRIHYMGYDIIFMNHINSKDYIQRNALSVVDLINYINANKEGEERIVLVGASMGGLLSRYALLYMENNNINSNTRLFVSFDSPQQGANIPLGVQNWLWFFSRIDAPGGPPQAAIDGLSIVNSPAARQMLTQHYVEKNFPVWPYSPYPGVNPDADGNCPDALRTNFLDDLELAGQYPTNQLLRKVAISNGSKAGYYQTAYSGGPVLMPGENIIDWDYSGPFYWEGIEVGDGDVKGNAYAVSENTAWLENPNRLLVECLWDIPFYSTSSLTAACPTNLKCYDGAPGGWRNTTQLMAGNTGQAGEITTQFPHQSFIPTISALDLRDLNDKPLDLYTNVAMLTSGSYKTPFDAFYADLENNDHITVTPGIADFLIKQLEYREPAPANFTCVSFSLNEMIFEWDPVVNPIEYTFYYSHLVAGQWINESIKLGLPTPTPEGKLRFIFNSTTGLPANWISYRFAATALCKGGETDFSNWFSLDYPIKVHGIISSTTSATIKWTDNNNGEESFAVWWRKSDQPDFNSTPNLVVASASGIGATLSVEATGLEAGARYFFKVAAKYGDVYTREERQIYLTTAAPEQSGFAGRIDNMPKDGKPYIKIQLANCREFSYITVERKIDNGNWEIVLTTKSGWVENESIEHNEIADFNHTYYYRTKAVNVLGSASYTCWIDGEFGSTPVEELPINTKFIEPQITSIGLLDAEEDNAFLIKWSDESNPIFSTGFKGYFKKSNETLWQQATLMNIQTWEDEKQAIIILPNIEFMNTYEIKIVKNWSDIEKHSNVVQIFVPYKGYTDYDNARRLFRAGDGTLNAAFYNDSLVYHAKSSDNGLNWIVENPGIIPPVHPHDPAYGIKGPHPTISEKIATNSVYSVRAKQDSLLLDSLGLSLGLGKVILAGGSKKFNPAIVTDQIGDVHCVWAETTVTYEENLLHRERVKNTLRVCYIKKTASGWSPVQILQPTEVDTSGWTGGSLPTVLPMSIPCPTIATVVKGVTIRPQISWVRQHWSYDRSATPEWSLDTAAVYHSDNLNNGEQISSVGSMASSPCLGVSATGTVVLSYQQNGDIYRSTNNGSTWSTPYNVSNNTGSSQMPTVAYDQGGAMHVLWFDNSESGFVQKTSTLPAGTDAKLAIAKLTELPQGEESIIWEDNGDVAIDALTPTLAKAAAAEDLTATVNATQIFYRRYKDNAWSPIYRLTASVEPSVYPSLPLTDNAAQMGFIWTEGSGVKYKRLPDLDGPTVAVTYPNGGELLYSGRRYNITWSSTDNRGIKEYALYYTTNYIAQDDPTAIDAVTLWRTVATLPGNLNSYSWRVPYNVASTACRFKVVAYDSSGNTATDIGDKNFTIKSRDIAIVVTDKAIAYNNAGKIARSSDGLLHVCYNGIDSVHYLVSSDDGQTWTTSPALDKGSLPTIATDSKNMPAMAWIKQWDYTTGGGVFFSRQTANGWTAPETLAYMNGVPWDYIGGYSPPAMTIKNDTISLVYEYSYGGGIPPHVAKGWSLHHARFAVNNIASKKDTIIDSYTEIVNPPDWQAPASASIATDYKGYDHISWHRTDKVYYRIRKPDGNYGNIVQLSGSGIAQNPCISISGVASAVWVEEGDIYQRTGFDQKWATAVNVSASGANSMMPYICGSDVLWTEDVLSDYEVYLSSYSTAKMTYDISENLSCTDYASIFPHETKLQTNEGTKTYRIWAEEIEPEVLWGLTFMADTTELEPTYALDAGQVEPSIFTVQRDGYITYGTAAKAKNTVTEPFKTVDYDTTALIYSFDNFDPDKKYKITMSFYQETGQEIKLKPIANKLSLGEIKVTSGEEAILDKPLPEAS
ncbi:MAG: hypothetical protein Q7W05_01035, partial [Deltaproteobacteria bacterium]|nr:hypothetical protein [Deltaproteobacteria bacterium]